MGFLEDSNLNVVKMSQVTTTTTSSTYSMSSRRTRTNTPLWFTSPWTLIIIVVLVSQSCGQVGANDPVYIRSSAFMGSYGQLVTSSTLRWVKGQTKDSVTLVKANQETGVICRVWHTGLRGVGLVAKDMDVCNINTQEGDEGSEKYQTLSGRGASRLVWSTWTRPNPPPTGSVAISVKPQKFVASDTNSTMIGYLDAAVNLGSAIFPNDHDPATTCLVLTEIEPTRYELSDVQLKRNKGFIEEDIVLAYGRLKYEASDSDKEWNLGSTTVRQDGQGRISLVDLQTESNDVNGKVSSEQQQQGKEKRGRIESILSYETNNYDYWGQGYLMAKGLHTSINLPDGSTKVIEWGIPLTQAGKTETMTAVADLLPETGVNVTLKGTRLNGEMSYWASLKTHFKDGSFSTRLIDGHRKVIEIRNIRLEQSKAYFLSNNSMVPEPTTTTTTSTTTTSTLSPTAAPNENNSNNNNEEESASAALPIESDIQADQSQNLMADMKSSSPAAKSIALSHAAKLFCCSGFNLLNSLTLLAVLSYVSYFSGLGQ